MGPRSNINHPWIRSGNILAFSLLLSMVAGCTGITVREPANQRAFSFKQDTFSYANELDWEYKVDPVTGQTTTQTHEPEPTFGHRCFAVARMARQFFQYAKFDPKSPKVEDETYRKIIDAVVTRSPGEARRNGKVIVPGYADLRSFSRAEESLLKDATGGAWRSTFHFSNWRMIFPFSRNHQEETARQLLAEVSVNRLPIVHLIRFKPFPVADINHVIVIVAATESEQDITFRAYDPNNARQSVPLTFDRASRTFIFPATNYFADGPIDVYEIFENELN